MQIQQLSVSYVGEQDRILTRIMTQDQQELALLFTRKLMLGLWPLVQRAVTDTTAAVAAAQPQVAVADPAARQAMAEFARESSLAEADFKTPYKAEVRWRPLGPAPLLVTEVRVSAQPQGRLALAWIEKLPEGAPRQFEMTLEQPMIHGLMQLLQQALTASEWLLGWDKASEVSAFNALGAMDRPAVVN